MEMTAENMSKLEEIRAVLDRDESIEALDVAGDIVPLVETVELCEFSLLAAEA